MSRYDFLDATRTNWGEVRKHQYNVVVLPWGALEPHNYHLPYYTDAILSQEIALDSAGLAYQNAGIKCMVLPPVFLGSQNPGQCDLPFCIHTNYETQKHILTDIVQSLFHQGFRKLVIINGHGGNTFKSMIRDLAVVCSDFVIVTVNWYDFIPRNNYFDEKTDDHAGEQETSAMLHYYPERVNLASAGEGKANPHPLQAIQNKVGWIPRNWKETTEDTGIGNPHSATAEKGKQYLIKVTEKISDLLIELSNYKGVE